MKRVIRHSSTKEARCHCFDKPKLLCCSFGRREDKRDSNTNEEDLLDCKGEEEEGKGKTKWDREQRVGV